MLTPISSCEAIRENNARTEREYLARQEERSKRARTEAPRVTALQREFAPRMAAQARAAKAARALEALNAELREATRMAIGIDCATWHSDGFGDSFLGLASRIAATASRIAVDANGATNDAARIAESAEAVVAANE